MINRFAPVLLLLGLACGPVEEQVEDETPTTPTPSPTGPRSTFYICTVRISCPNVVIPPGSGATCAKDLTEAKSKVCGDTKCTCTATCSSDGPC